MDTVGNRAASFLRRPIPLSLFVALSLILIRLFAVYLKGWIGDARRKWRHHHKRSHRSSKNRSTMKEIQESLPNILILLGIPYSGKTTWATQYKARCDRSYTIVSIDEVEESITESTDSLSRDEKVFEKTVEIVTQLLLEKQNVILDDSHYILKTEFRRRILSISIPCNHLVKEFPIKSIFAYARVEKNAEHRGKRGIPTRTELEKMEVLFAEAHERVKEEGWIQLLDSVYSNSHHGHRSKRRSQRA